VGWSLLRKTELRRHLCPSWIDEGVDDDRAGRRLAGLPSAVTEAALSFASVWVELPSEHVAAVCRELRLSNRRTRSVGWLIGALTVIRRGAEIELADLKRIAADRDWPSLTLLFAADQQARGEPDQCYLAVMRRVAGIPPERISPPPLITGEDLLRLGAQPGPRFADVLSQVERKQMNEEIATYEEAIALARSLLSR